MNSECGSLTIDLLCVVLSPSASSRKWSCPDSVTNEGKKCRVSYSTYGKWQHEFDKECQIISWLNCDVTGKRKRNVRDWNVSCPWSTNIELNPNRTIAISG